MSAQDDLQVSPISSSSRILQRMKGSFSSGSQSLLQQGGITLQVPPTVDPNSVTPQPTAPPQPESMEQPEQDISPDAQTVTGQVVEEAPKIEDTLNPPNIGVSLSKEAPALSVTVENPVVDASGGTKYVEAEKSHELPPEVEGFIKTVENHHDQIPQEIVIANPQTGQALPRVLAQPVIVLPITPEIEEEGKKKTTTYSVRWLIEWSWKIMKAFSGKVVYRTVKN